MFKVGKDDSVVIKVVFELILVRKVDLGDKFEMIKFDVVILIVWLFIDL